MELLYAIVALVVGMSLGVWMRRLDVSAFERGVQLGLSQLPNLVKAQQQPPRQHEHNHPKNNGPQDKK